MPGDSRSAPKREKVRPRLREDAIPTIFANSNDEFIDEEDLTKLYKIRNGEKEIKYTCVDPKCGNFPKQPLQKHA